MISGRGSTQPACKLQLAGALFLHKYRLMYVGSCTSSFACPSVYRGSSEGARYRDSNGQLVVLELDELGAVLAVFLNVTHAPA